MGYGDSRYIRVAVPRPLSDWEMEDVKMVVKNVMEQRSFFYAGTDDVADEVVRFVANNQIFTNLEEVTEEE